MKLSLINLLLVFFTLSSPIKAQECVERKSISLAIAIDVSGSMSSSLNQARDFAIGVINGLNSTGKLSEVDVFLFNGAIPGYAGTSGEIVWNTPNAAVNWLASLDNSDALGGTALFSAAYVGALITNARNAGNFKLFVLITDGEDDGSSSHTMAQASAELGKPGLVSKLIFVGGSNAGANALNSMAAGAGANSQALNASINNLNSLINGIVDATCVNHRPVASFTKSDDNLKLGIDGFNISFDGSSSNDKETPSANLTYEWTFKRPDGSTYARNTRTFSEPFTDNQLNIGTNWQVTLVVKDAKGVASNSVSQNFTVTGSPPNITLTSGPPSPFNANVTASISANPATDIDGGNLTFAWSVLTSPVGGILPNPLNTQAIPLSGVEQNITTFSDGTDFRIPWKFHCVATDNENQTDAKDITVKIKNLPPKINFVGDKEIDVNFAIQVATDVLNDEDGGILTFKWDIIQAPISAPIMVQNSYSVSSSLNIPTTDAYAGTWIFRLTAKDNEGEEVKKDFNVLVDGLPTAKITGPVAGIGSITGFPLKLKADLSVDADSRIDLPNSGHATLEPPVKSISPAIITYRWSLIDAPSDNPDLFALGNVNDIWGINSAGVELEIPLSKKLTEGYYTFLLEVEDGEHNWDSEEFQVQIIKEESNPISLVLPHFVERTVDPVTNVLATGIAFDGSFSFDPDNFLSGPITQGISNYEWTYTYAPLGCPITPILPVGAAASTAVLFAPGTVVPLICQGLWKIALKVTDDDMPAKESLLNEAIVVIGNCPTNLCIDYPTHSNPQTVQFTDAVDVLIYFHLNALLYTNPAAVAGTLAKLEITYEGDPNPFYTSIDPNLLATDNGGYLLFHWNGYGNANQRPKSGKYNVSIKLLDQSMITTIGGDDQLSAILIAIADPAILPSSDKAVARDKLVALTDKVDINYTITGGGVPDELKWRVYDDGNFLVQEGSVAAPPANGSFSWDGKNKVPVIVPLGKYYIEIETLLKGVVMGKSPKYEVLIFGADIDANTNRDNTIDDLDEANENVWTTALGSIFNVNYDRDGARMNGLLPMNDVIFINDLGKPTLEDKIIDNVADVQDITPFIIRKSMDVIPATMKVFLKVSDLEEIQSIHVFKKIEAAQTAIWGSLGSRVVGGVAEPMEIDITDYVNPASPNFQGDPGTKDCTFGLEGMFFTNSGVINPFKGLVNLTLEYREGVNVVSSDAIAMKVAPFMMISHAQASLEVWVENHPLNAAMRNTANAKPGYKALEFSGQKQELISPGSQWIQDHIEIGYYERPGGPKTHCVFRLPYNNTVPMPFEPTWPLTKLLNPNFAEFQLGDNILGGSGDYGGNLEILPPNAKNKNGKIVIGTRRSTEMIDFLKAQEFQQPVEVNTKWLQVGHVDEMLGFTGNPNEMIVADPTDAYALMNAIPAVDRGKSVFFDLGTILPQSGAATGVDVTGKKIITGIDHTVGPAWQYVRIYSDGGSGAKGQVGRIKLPLQNGFIEIDKVWTTKSNVLPIDNPMIGAYGKFILGPEAPHGLTWGVNPAIGDKYVLVENTQFWGSGTPAIITVEEILADPELQLLNLTDAKTEINATKTAIQAANIDPMTFISVPTIYFGVRAGFATNQLTVALTPGLANFQSVNGKLYFPRQFGPKNAMNQDIFEITTLGRVANAVFTDDWDLYHRMEGEVHCGTSTKRVLPAFDWWKP